MKEITIHVFNTVGNSFCVEAEDGDKVYALIKKALEEEKNVKVSFQNIELLTSAFLNTAIGQLYKDFPEEKIKKHLSIDQLSMQDVALLKRVISTAKLYYQNPKRMEESINEILGE